MKQDYPKMGIGSLCRLLGKTRHAYYDNQWRIRDQGLKEDIVIQNVLEIRREIPRIGTLKLHKMLTPVFRSHDIKIGRDYMFDLLREHGLQVRRGKGRVATTNSRHWMHKYANLIKGLTITRPEQLWVSDITYIRFRNQWGYLSLITDAYSKQIMGFCFRKDLSAQGCIEALTMALGNRMYPEGVLIHHSDRGSQYCSKAYVDRLLEEKVAISMTENGDPYENAIAERVNGIIKTEFNLHNSTDGFKETLKRIAHSINAYNTLRPHLSIDLLTPVQAHLQTGILKKRWKEKSYNLKEELLV